MKRQPLDDSFKVNRNPVTLREIVLDKLRAAIEQVEIPGCDHVTISLGVAQLGEGESGDSLAVRVNAALGRAKRAGRNCVELAMS